MSVASQKNEIDAWEELLEWRRRGDNRRLKWTLKQRMLTGSSSALFRIFTHLVGATARWTLTGDSAWRESLLESRTHFVFAMWHNRLSAPMVYFNGHSRRLADFRMAPIVSESLDGELIARTARELGAENIRGSSSSRAVGALKSAVREAGRGLNICITGDGPRGPRYRMQPGAVMLASLTGLPIIPTSWASTRTLQFHRSWDQLMVPLPGAAIELRFGEPLEVAQDAGPREIVKARRELERRLGRLTEWADSNTRITWQFPRPRRGERLKRRKTTIMADKRI